MLLPRTQCFGVIGIFVTVFSIFFGFTWKFVFYKLLEKYLSIRPNSLIFDLWHAPPTIITMDFYIFNWTNSEDFRNPAVKPKFQELGPYRFFEYQKKIDIVWNANNATVTYRKKSTYEFDPKGSRGSLNDKIITINSIAVAAATLSKGFDYSKHMISEIGMLIYSRDLTLKKTVDELLFAGFSDTLLGVINAIPMSGVRLPFDKYGYCYGRNESSTYFGTYNVHTGGDNYNDIGQMYAWNYENYTTSYPRQCSKIRGSAGEFQGPYMKINSTKNLFIREFCHDIPLEFDAVTKVDGVRGFRFVGGHHAIDNGTIYPENACLCNGECLPSGVMNVSGCWFNSPLFISYPHFYKADPYYLTDIEGLSPDKEKHEFYYTIEPKTSIGLDIVARTQLNQLVRPISNSRMFHDVRKIMFPLFWAEARTRLPPDLLDYFRLIEKIIFCGQIFACVCLIMGLMMFIRHLALARLKKNCSQYFCKSSLQAAMEVSAETKSYSVDYGEKARKDNSFFKSFKTWKEVENFKTSITEKSPCNKPLLT